MVRVCIIPVLAAAAWISVSEFVRNEFWLKSVWVDHYAAMGLTFPDAPINGMFWGVWSLLMAAGIKIILTRFTFTETVALSWLMGFVLMWVVTGNMGVLPFSILLYAVPFSILEVCVAAWIIKKITPEAA